MQPHTLTEKKKKKNTFDREGILRDYRIAYESRQASLLGRKEVFAGKAKFGIFGDGKEIAQLAMAKVFMPGDFRSGYYRDQTFMFALGELTIQQYFAQLYAHADLEAEPATGGRLMNGHFATPFLNPDGSWKKLSESYNSTADVSPTGSQMPRLVGLAYASKLYRKNPALKKIKNFSKNGNEIAFGTIGNASTSEGMFFEALNAAGVLQIPMFVSVWDDAYGISVAAEHQTTKSDISKILEGFQRTKSEKGFEIVKVRGWDYFALCEAYRYAADLCRKEHVPVLMHVTEMTQPQGHSTSGSHERYKSKDRLAWEAEYDCIRKMREQLLEKNIATEKELTNIEQEAEETAKKARSDAWKAFREFLKPELDETSRQLTDAETHLALSEQIGEVRRSFDNTPNATLAHAVEAVKKTLRILRNHADPAKEALKTWLGHLLQLGEKRYSSHLYSESEASALRVEEIKPMYDESSREVDGREVLQACFDAALKHDPMVFAIGEDVGKIGDVNQAFAGLQAKYGELRVTDTGIRECTIVGQGIGAALRGLRPIVEIQYLDYLLYTLQILSDDLACLQYRTVGQQKAPLIVRTRGHRLEGVWHSGSPMGMILHSLRGMHVLVPRNMTQAAGFYNTMLHSDEPALIIECLNGYRLKEKLPANIGEFRVPLGVPEILREGEDITVVTYGSMCRIVAKAAEQLQEIGISCEILDVQTLLPFDVHHAIVKSVQKTNRVLFADEDVPGGASAFMMRQVLEVQGAYRFLDSEPRTLTAKEHRPAYADDGDYFSKPNVEDVFDTVYALMHEADPTAFPVLY